jgi:hypothetical protein
MRRRMLVFAVAGLFGALLMASDSEAGCFKKKCKEPCETACVAPCPTPQCEPCEPCAPVKCKKPKKQCFLFKKKAKCVEACAAPCPAPCTVVAAASPQAAPSMQGMTSGQAPSKSMP